MDIERPIGNERTLTHPSNVIDARTRFRAGPRGIATTSELYDFVSAVFGNGAPFTGLRDQEAGDAPDAA